MKKHQKHTPLTRPFHGNYARQEFTFIGAPCDLIHSFCQNLIDTFSNFSIGIVDAAHQSDDQRKVKSALNYVDNITHHTLEWEGSLDAYDAHSIFAQQDFVLVNGNHFKGKNQIVFIDSKKKESLQKKLDRLDDVHLFILVEGEEAIWDYLQDDYAAVPVLKISDKEGIHSFFTNLFSVTIPPLCGLVMVGGKSMRMGEDKARIDYHGVAQEIHAKQLLDPFVDQVYTSVSIISSGDSTEIRDTFTGLGPFGGILSAFREYPECAFLVLACDLPKVDVEAIRYLVERRNTSKLATAFLNSKTGFADPLFTIWEPKAYMTMLQFLAQGYSCPRKVLINSDIALIDLPNEDWLRNVNTPEERAALNL